MQARRIILTILFVLLSLICFGQRFANVTLIATDTDVSTNFWRTGTLVYVADQEIWRRTTQDWSIGVAFNTITSTAADHGITSSANELIMNVAGTVQGQSQFTYEPTSNLMNIGLSHVLTNTNQNNNLNFGNGNDWLGTGLIRHSQMIGHNHSMNSATGSIQWSLALGEQHNFETSSTGVINNSVMLGGFNNDIINTVTDGSFGSFIIGSSTAEIRDSGIQRAIIASNGSDILQSANYSGIYSGQSNILPASTTHSVIVGGQGITPSTTTHTVFMPKIAIGLGIASSGALATATTANRVLLRNTGNGFVNQADANVIPMASASPGAGQDGQVLEWDNTGGNWVYATPGGGGAFWPLTGNGQLTGNTTIFAVEGASNLTMNGFDVLTLGAQTTIDVDVSGTLDIDPNTYRLDATDIDITLGNTEPTNEVLSINHTDNFSKATSMVLEEVSNEEVVSLNSANATDNTQVRVTPTAVDLTFGSEQITIDDTYIRTAEVSLSNAQLLAINTTPVEAVPAPGIGQAILIMSQPYLFYDHVTSDFGPNDDILLQVGTTSHYRFLNALSGSVDSFTMGDVFPVTAVARTAIENQAVNIVAQTGNPTLGGGTAKVFITYRIIDL